MSIHRFCYFRLLGSPVDSAGLGVVTPNRPGLALWTTQKLAPDKSEPNLRDSEQLARSPEERRRLD